MQVTKGHLTFPELLRRRQTSGGVTTGLRKNGESDDLVLLKILYFF